MRKSYTSNIGMAGLFTDLRHGSQWPNAAKQTISIYMAYQSLTISIVMVPRLITLNRLCCNTCSLILI